MIIYWIYAAAAKLRQSCPTLCDPIDRSPPGSSVPGILQARKLEWVSISFSNAQKWKVKLKHSVVSDSSRLHGLQPTRLLCPCPWDFPGKSTGLGCHCLLQLIYATLLKKKYQIYNVALTQWIFLFLKMFLKKITVNSQMIDPSFKTIQGILIEVLYLYRNLCRFMIYTHIIFILCIYIIYHIKNIWFRCLFIYIPISWITFCLLIIACRHQSKVSQ